MNQSVASCRLGLYRYKNHRQRNIENEQRQQRAVKLAADIYRVAHNTETQLFAAHIFKMPEPIFVIFGTLQRYTILLIPQITSPLSFCLSSPSTLLNM